MQYDDVETAVKLALKKFGKIDILINGKLHLLRLILCGNYYEKNVFLQLLLEISYPLPVLCLQKASKQVSYAR